MKIEFNTFNLKSLYCLEESLADCQKIFEYFTKTVTFTAQDPLYTVTSVMRGADGYALYTIITGETEIGEESILIYDKGQIWMKAKEIEDLDEYYSTAPAHLKELFTYRPYNGNIFAIVDFLRDLGYEPTRYEGKLRLR